MRSGWFKVSETFTPRARKPLMNLLSQRQTERRKERGSVRNRKRDSVNTRGEVEMSVRKQSEGGEKKGKGRKVGPGR